MGTKTLLNGVNDILQSNRVVTSSGALASLTDSARQVFIDQAVQVINRTMIDLYVATDNSLPLEMGSSTVVLATNDRSYALASGLVQMRWPLRDETNGVYIQEYPGGYHALVTSQPQPSNYTGVPSYGAISPINGEIYLDRLPTAAENGNTYAYEYDKALVVSGASDTFPFSDTAWESFMDAAKELWRRENNLQFDPALYQQRIGNAATLITQVQTRRSYRPDSRVWRSH